MDETSVTRFVNTFIVKNRRERLLHELTTPKKRYRGISRFCHRAKDLLDPAFLVAEGEDLERLPAFRRFVRDHSGPCLLLSPYPWLDEEIMPLEKAVEQAAVCPDAVLILGDGFAVVFEEPQKGGRGRFWMSEGPVRLRD